MIKYNSFLKFKIEFKNDDIDFELLKKRGPDSFEIKVLNLNDNLKLVFCSSVLSLRGGRNRQVTKQPLIDSKTGNILLWNGEIFQSDLVTVNDDENDGQNLLNKLNESTSDDNEKFLLKTFESIQGPYAFVFYEARTNSIFFGRDRLGRRSLLISLNNHNLTLSSVKIKPNRDSSIDMNEFEELKANGIYKVNLNKDPILSLNVFEWKKLDEIANKSDNKLRYYEHVNESSNYNLFDSISPFNEILEELNDDNFEQTVDIFYKKLRESVMRRVKNIPNFCKKCSHRDLKSHEAIKFNTNSNNNYKCNHAKLAILFSGGVDSTVLAALADLCLPPNEEIDLLNIAFEKQKNSVTKKTNKAQDEEDEDDLINNLKNEYDKNDEFLVPDRISGLESLKELNKNRKWNFVEINITLDELRKERENLIKNLLYPHMTVLDDSIGCALWFASRGHGFVRDNSDAKIPYTSNAEVLLLGILRFSF
jgi:asparagine synthetase B (glutamine-hydrolysing)